MRDLENDRAFDIHRPRAPYEQGADTAGMVLEHHGAIGTGDYSAAIKTGALPRQTLARGSGTVQRRSPRMAQSPEVRAAIRKLFRAAKEAARKMVDAAAAQDPVSLTIAVDDLDMGLSSLWELRENRDDNWQTIINHAQCMFRQLFAEKRVEQLTSDQCRSIQELVENYIGTSTKSTSDLNEAVRLIEDAGCDPYWAISGDPTAEEQLAAQE